MKNLKILLILGFALISVSYSPRTEVDPMDIRFMKLYPEWFSLNQEQQEDRIDAYLRSPNKYLWFPDLYPAPENFYTSKKSRP